ncbi:MAG TPA: hypothetical protein DIW77_00265 [Chromatiaceae bacterium]|nr:MAG: hypothetical protein N838_17805 [Thiohalocapsa sp. PB-PSB1]HCS88520.1 hypothetical protein [Chromatiaceae bacterium]
MLLLPDMLPNATQAQGAPTADLSLYTGGWSIDNSVSARRNAFTHAKSLKTGSAMQNPNRAALG